MTGNIYTLEILHDYSHEDIHIPKNFSCHVILVGAVIYSLVVSMSNNFSALLLASILPVMLLLKNRSICPQLVKLNAVNFFMAMTFALTWPVIREGCIVGMLIALRVNMIYIIFATLIFHMGATKIYQALFALGIPGKLRVLIILTLRGIFILHERFQVALTSVRLRAPGLKGIAKFRVLAYMTASSLLQSSDRSERMLNAIQCKGGFHGFNQCEDISVKKWDIVIYAGIIIYSSAIIYLNYA